MLQEVVGFSKSYRSTRAEVRRGGVFVTVQSMEKLFVCPRCQSRENIRRGKRMRRGQTVPIGFHPVRLEVEVPRCQCQSCQHLFEIAPLLPGLTVLRQNAE